MTVQSFDGVKKTFARIREDFGAHWIEEARPVLVSVAEDDIRAGLSPEQAAVRLRKMCAPSAEGEVGISKGELRGVIAEAFAGVKEFSNPGHGAEVQLSSLDDGIYEVPSTPEEHLTQLFSEVRNWRSEGSFGFGIYELDKAFGGLYPSEMMALVGAPGSMKTSLALNMTDSFLGGAGSGSVAFFSLDMPAQTIVARRLMRELDCFQSELYGMIRRHDPAVEDARRRVAEADGGRFKLFGKPRGGRNYSWHEISQIIMQTAPELVIIDYLTLIGQYRSELEAVYELIPKIKSLADEMGIAMLLLSQMGRGSRAAQKSDAGGHAAGGHYVEDAADVEIELLKDRTADGRSAIVATVTKTRKNQSGRSFALDLRPRSLEFGSTADEVGRTKLASSVFNI